MTVSHFEQNRVAPRLHDSWKRVRAFYLDDRGQAATEYILVIGLIAIFLIVAYNKLQDSLRALLARVAGFLNGPGI